MDVEEVLVKYKVSYLPRGGDFEVRCLSPEHDDSNPSMRIDRFSGVFNCFSCGFKGNIFHLFDEEGQSEVVVVRTKFEQLLAKKKAESTGLDVPAGSIPYRGTWRDISAKTYEKFEAFTNHESEYSSRVMFPLKDFSGRIRAFIGRTTTDILPKYKVYPRQTREPVYPFFERVHGSVILVEGIYDAINLYDKGLPNAVCTFGTNKFTKEKIQLLKVAGVEKVYVFFDGDKPGQEAAKNIKQLCEDSNMVSQNICLMGTDPGELPLNKVTNLKEKLYG